ncbi:MAG TPA: hypothetical protein VFZ12_07935 [Dehalococcoidia bacterium]|nr:hypothetical protein [Dehalococcoidia bacterium]
MSPRVLFVTSWQFSPRVCEMIPATRTLLDDLRAEYEVDIFPWPTFKDGPGYEPTWPAIAEHIRAELQPGTHVVVTGATTAVAMAALSGDTQASSFITAGMIVPPATLRSLGMNDLASGVELAGRISHSVQSGYQTMQTVMAGAPAAEVRRITKHVDADVDWRRARRFSASFGELDLVQEAPLITVPTLCLDVSVKMPGWAEMSKVFRLFVPNAAGGELKLWPGKLQDPAAGRDFATKAKEFIKQVHS